MMPRILDPIAGTDAECLIAEQLWIAEPRNEMRAGVEAVDETPFEELLFDDDSLLDGDCFLDGDREILSLRGLGRLGIRVA